VPYIDDDTLADHISENDIVELCDDERAAINESTIAGAIAVNPAIRTRIDNAISNAESKINAMARMHWETPIRIDASQSSTPENTPSLVGLLAAQLTIVKLFQRRPGSMIDLPDGVKDLRKEADDLLKLINHGNIDLGINPAPQTSPLVVATADGSPRVFTEESLKDF
jgi:hypothetical protein